MLLCPLVKNQMMSGVSVEDPLEDSVVGDEGSGCETNCPSVLEEEKGITIICI